MAAEFSARDVVVIGGGCYGTFYARQLERARAQGKAEYRRLRIVDHDPGCRFAREIGESDTAELVVRDWGPFFDDYLAAASEPAAGEMDDTIVPSPLMPHLMYQWLLRRAQARWPGREVVGRPVTVAADTPYDTLAPDGTRYVSFADWLCPTHCVEPATCPIIRAPRTWDMADAMHALTRRLARSHPAAGPVLFVCRHRIFGVGMFDVRTVVAGDAVVAEAGTPGTPVDVVVGTISSCHGAVSLLHLGAGRC
jgi:hypothetical protein